MLSAFQAHIPLIVIWPERIAPGQRLRQAVSMIDILPSILDLAGLAQPEVKQGQSLAPLLLGEEGWEPRPIILDEFQVDPETNELRGTIEVIDGRWGASLYIDPNLEDDEVPLRGHRDRPAPGSKAWENRPEKIPLPRPRCGGAARAPDRFRGAQPRRFARGRANHAVTH